MFLYSSIGATLAVSVACFLFARLRGQWQRIVFIGVTRFLIRIATVHALAQHQGYFEDAQRQHQILANILSQAPHLEPGTTVLLIDRTPTAAFKAWSLCTGVSSCLERALRDPTLRAMRRATALATNSVKNATLTPTGSRCHTSIGVEEGNAAVLSVRFNGRV